MQRSRTCKGKAPGSTHTSPSVYVVFGLVFTVLALQVRGMAGEHQVDGAKVALAQAYGASAQYFSMWVVADSLDPFAA